MYKKLDFSTWNRKEHFDFFMKFEEPYHGVTVNMDITKIKTDSPKAPITSLYLFNCIKAVNQLQALKIRIVNKYPVVYDTIDMGVTILRENGTFAYIRITYNDSLTIFDKNFREEIINLNTRPGLFPENNDAGIIHGSVLPWIQFTGLSHARTFSQNDGVPKITFGKIFSEKDSFKIPMSIHLHHALADGKDIADFISTYQNLLDNA